MLVYFIRHGQTDWNVQRRFQGNLDIPLNETGRNQARQIAARFAGMHWSRIYHSPLSRAAETARIVCAQSPVEMVSVPDLREICMGDWEGMDFAQVKAIMPQEYARYLADRGHVAPPNGESFQMLQSRALRAMEPLLARETADFAVVAHGAIFKALFCAYLHIDFSYLDGFDIANASVSVVNFTNGHAKVITLNDLSHFADPYRDLSSNQAVL